ncbi:hypothetical protein [Peribacillus loiseleuriae]|nr:hypothetical protein [Peribacillus loiseleuriae]
MNASIAKEDFYHILKEAFEKGESEGNLTVSELIEELSLKLQEIIIEV